CSRATFSPSPPSRPCRPSTFPLDSPFAGALPSASRQALGDVPAAVHLVPAAIPFVAQVRLPARALMVAALWPVAVAVGQGMVVARLRPVALRGLGLCPSGRRRPVRLPGKAVGLEACGGGGHL